MTDHWTVKVFFFQHKQVFKSRGHSENRLNLHLKQTMTTDGIYLLQGHIFYPTKRRITHGYERWVADCFCLSTSDRPGQKTHPPPLFSFSFVFLSLSHSFYHVSFCITSDAVQLFQPCFCIHHSTFSSPTFPTQCPCPSATHLSVFAAHTEDFDWHVMLLCEELSPSELRS